MENVVKDKRYVSFEDLLIYVDLTIADAYDEFQVKEVEELKKCMDRIYEILDELRRKHKHIYDWLMESGAYV